MDMRQYSQFGMKNEMSYSLMTPLIREAIRLTSLGLDGRLDLIRTALLSTTVSMALSPAALIVSPDSVAYNDH